MTLLDALIEKIIEFNPRIVTHVPGFGGTEIFEKLESIESPLNLRRCYHEEVAFGISFGVSLSGSRNLTIIKTHGVSKAANAVQSALSLGSVGASILLVSHDPEGKHSDNILDPEKLLDGIEIPYYKLDEKNYDEAFEKAVAFSEEASLPVVLLFEAEAVKRKAVTARRKVPKAGSIFQPKTPSERLVCPLFGKFQRERFLHRKNNEGTILPVDEVERINQLPVEVQEKVKSYQGFFGVIQNIPNKVMIGETSLSSLYGLKPYELVNYVCYYGGSVPIATGVKIGRGEEKRVFSLNGDFSFLSTAGISLTELINESVALDIVVFKNGVAGATGGQKFPLKVLDHLCSLGDFNFEEIFIDHRDALKKRFIDSPRSVRVTLINMMEFKE